jgi:transcriptional regulator with XRE-family HTH domain
MQQNAPTMKEIAKILGVSVSTVSRALQNHPRIGSRTRERVKKLVSELHYQPDSRAINFKNKKSFNVGVVLPSLTEQFFSLALSGIEETLMAEGYSMVVMQSKNEYARETAAIASLIKHGVDGILVSLAAETYNKSHFYNATHQVPIVFFDRILKHPRYSSVYVDLAQSGTGYDGVSDRKGIYQHRIDKRPQFPAGNRRQADRVREGAQRTRRSRRDGIHKECRPVHRRHGAKSNGVAGLTEVAKGHYGLSRLHRTGCHAGLQTARTQNQPGHPFCHLFQSIILLLPG